MNSTPAKTQENAARAAPPSRGEHGGLTERESEGEGTEVSGEAGVEGEKEEGSWTGRLTARDRELVGHLGLVRYLRTNQATELVFAGRAQSVVSSRLGELSQRHGNTRALLKKLWFVSGEGKRVQVWSLTPSGYALAEDVLDKKLKIPRDDVASQFLEHATGVNELYVALTKKNDAPRTVGAVDRRGKPANDFARLPTALRWLPSEELELPFQEFVPEEHKVHDRRLQPAAMLEDPARKRRYLIEYETGSASVRNAQHKSATLTKVIRYQRFRSDPHGRGEPFYKRNFGDQFEPVLLFMTRTAARRDSIKQAVEEWSKNGGRACEIRAATVEQISRELRAQLLGARALAPAAAPRPIPDDIDQAQIAPRGWPVFSPREVLLFHGAILEAITTIQMVRHTVREGRSVVAEPRYAPQLQEAEQKLRRHMEKLRSGGFVAAPTKE
jgi:hypothetical protein